MFSIFANLFIILLNRRQPDSYLISASALNLLPYVVLVELYEENLVSHRCVVGKYRSILKAFQVIVDILGYQTKTQVVISERLVAMWNLKLYQ